MFALRALASAIAGLAVLAPVASATVVRHVSLEALVRAAPRIVVTEVVDVRAERSRGADGELPITLVTLRVLETLKGGAALQLGLEFLGGHLTDSRLEIGGMPRFRAGDRDVLFLHETPGMLSPIVGVFAGRFRIQSIEGWTEPVVRADDTGPLPDTWLTAYAASSARAGATEVTLPAFTRAVRRAVVAAPEGNPGVRPAVEEGDSILAAQSAVEIVLPDCLRVTLGPAPTLSNGCRDWECAVGRSIEAARQIVQEGVGLPAVVGADTARACVQPSTVEWGTAVRGRWLDDLTLAVLHRSASAGEDETRLVLNAAHVWNARDGQAVKEPVASLDVVSVLSRMLAALALNTPADVDRPAAADARMSGNAADARMSGKRVAREPSDRLSFRATAADPCAGGTGAVVNPRLVIFDSPDHARMTAYQVGFYLPRAQAPVTIVNLPLDAFLVRTALDLPQGEVERMQRTLVASISSAGLSTPIGRVYAYRVRGVWSGGTTAWSAASPSFVQCPR